jgi:3-oxoacyl-[acyl-carrier-protein] synthase II
VTGLGVICCLGNAVEEFWTAVCDGVYGIRPLTRFDTSRHAIKHGGEVLNFSAPSGSDLATAFTLAAGQQAVADSKLASAGFDPVRVGLVLGTNFGAMSVAEGLFEWTNTNGPIAAGSQAGPKLLAGVSFQETSCLVAEAFGLRGPISSLSLSCASGNAAIGYALDLIRAGWADAMIAGGYDAISEYVWTGLEALHTMTTEKIRPFDKNRSQTIFSEGAAVLAVEEAEHARRRGARVLCEVAGHAMNNNAYHMAHPDPGGEQMARVMRLALEDAGLSPEDVDHINSHGTGTKLNDVAETQAIKSVFGRRAYEIPINSIKSSVGHVMGAASAVEAVASVLTIRDGIIPPTINYETPDPECDLNYVPNRKMLMPVKTVLSNSAGIGGCNSVVIFRRV